MHLGHLVNDAKKLIAASVVASALVAVVALVFAIMSWRGEHILSAHVGMANAHLAQVSGGHATITAEQAVTLLGASAQVVSGASGMVHAGARAFGLCSLLSAAVVLCQLMLMRGRGLGS
jgi:hypothetical protein